MNRGTDDAKRILRNERPVPRLGDLKELVSKLKGELEFGLARKLLTKARADEPGDAWAIQQLALCTYKDEELLASTRFADAPSALAAHTPAEAYEAEQPVDIMDKAGALPTFPQAQQSQKDVINRILAA